MEGNPIFLQPLQRVKGNNYLLTIAINDYEFFNKLNNAVKDAEEITDILVKLYQFKPEHVHRLIDSDATEDGIDDKFLQLVDLIGEDDNIVIYFSGHGYFRENVKEGYWVPVNGRKDKVSDYISNANLIRYLQNIKARHLLLMVDSCFSGALVEQLKGDSNSDLFKSRRVFASGRTELVSDGMPGENSPFAKGIIDFLKANAKEAVPTSALIESVRTYVSTVSSQLPVEGRLLKSIDNGGEFFFWRTLTEFDLWNQTLAKGTLEAFEGFVKIYPDGEYSDEAYSHLERQRVLYHWGVAEKENTIDGYEDFILMNPNSDLVARAKANIATIQKTEELRQQTEEDRIRRIEDEQKKEDEYLRISQEYRETYRLAQVAMGRKAYREARKLLYECEKLFREKEERFVPNISTIQKEREACKRQILFHDYADEGRRAYGVRDYRVAIESFNAALAQMQDAAIQELRDAAIKLMSVSKTVKIAPKRDKIAIANPRGGGENPKPSGDSSSQKITVNRRPPVDAGGGSKPVKIVVKPGKTLPPVASAAAERRFVNVPQSAPVLKSGANTKALDLTWLWVVLLVAGYGISLKLLVF